MVLQETKTSTSQEEAASSTAYTAPKRGGKKALKDAIKRKEEESESYSSREADLSAYKSPALRAAEQQATKAASAMSTAPPSVSTPEPEAQAPKVQTLPIQTVHHDSSDQLTNTLTSSSASSHLCATYCAQQLLLECCISFSYERVELKLITFRFGAEFAMLERSADF